MHAGLLLELYYSRRADAVPVNAAEVQNAPVTHAPFPLSLLIVPALE